MSTGWIWTIWTVAMLVLAYLLLTVIDLGALNDIAVLIVGGLAISIVAVSAQRARDARTARR
jgi:hypothetical protein